MPAILSFKDVFSLTALSVLKARLSFLSKGESVAFSSSIDWLVGLAE